VDATQSDCGVACTQIARVWESDVLFVRAVSSPPFVVIAIPSIKRLAVAAVIGFRQANYARRVDELVERLQWELPPSSRNSRSPGLAPAAVTRSTDDEPSTEMTLVAWTERPVVRRMNDERRSSATGCDHRWTARRPMTTSPDAGDAAHRTSLPSPRQVLLILTLLATCCPGGKMSLLNHELVYALLYRAHHVERNNIIGGHIG